MSRNVALADHRRYQTIHHLTVDPHSLFETEMLRLSERFGALHRMTQKLVANWSDDMKGTLAATIRLHRVIPTCATNILPHLTDKEVLEEEKYMSLDDIIALQFIRFTRLSDREERKAVDDAYARIHYVLRTYA